uniref:Uncharacterized protein n=1 Tax=Meloidogyne incognita TaxID=6306 RepID=A0A914MTV8_MELIC
MPPKTILFYINILLFANIVLSVINSGIQSIAGGPSPSAMGEQINADPPSSSARNSPDKLNKTKKHVKFAEENKNVNRDSKKEKISEEPSQASTNETRLASPDKKHHKFMSKLKLVGRFIGRALKGGESSKKGKEKLSDAKMKALELEKKSKELDEFVSKFIKDNLTKDDIPHIYYPDPQIKVEKQNDPLFVVTNSSNNFKQLYSCIQFINIKENYDNLVEIIKKIKEGEGKSILELYTVDYVLKLLKKFEERSAKYSESLDEEDIEHEMRATQQILDINSAIKLGYLRYIYMEELCRNLDVYYDEDNEYRPFFIGACKGVRPTLKNIKKIILAKDKEEDKKKEKIILEEKKKHETKGNLETILEDEHENKKGKAVLVEDEHENKNNEENILEEENEGEH